MAAFGEQDVETVGAEALQRLKDRFMIVIGSDAAVEKIALRRIACHGRLCVVEAGDEARIVTEELQVCTPPDLWCHPEAAASADAPELARKLRSRPVFRFVKAGPDVVRLRADETIHVLQIGGQSIGVRVKADSGEIRWELSGCVLCRPSEVDVDTFDVAVENYDAIPLSVLDSKDVLIGLTLNLVGWTFAFAVMAAFDRTAAAPGQVPWWRLSFCIAGNLLAGPFVLMLWGTSLAGNSNPPWRRVVQNVVAGIVVTGTMACLDMSNFMISVGFCVPQLAATQVIFFETRKQFPGRKWLRHLAWGTAVVILTLGLYLQLYAVSLGYLALLASGHAAFASVFLPVMTSVLEVGGVMGITCMYSLLVAKPRAEAPESVLGSQRPVLQAVVALAHGWAEGTRAASFIAGCVKDPNDFLWSASLTLGCGMNIVTRLGWSSYWLSVLLSKCGGGDRLNCGGWLGTSMSKLHSQTKLFCGYFRLVWIMCIVLSRLIVYQEMDLSSPASPVFNWMALVAIAALMLAEVAEDCVVHLHFLPEPPFEDFHDKFYAELPNTSLNQLVMSVQVSSETGGCSSAIARNAEGRPYSTMNLHGVLYLPRVMTVGLITIAMIVTGNLFELLLGVGYLRGVCDQPVSNILEVRERYFYTPPPVSAGGLPAPPDPPGRVPQWDTQPSSIM